MHPRLPALLPQYTRIIPRPSGALSKPAKRTVMSSLGVEAHELHIVRPLMPGDAMAGRRKGSGGAASGTRGKAGV